MIEVWQVDFDAAETALEAIEHAHPRLADDDLERSAAVAAANRGLARQRRLTTIALRLLIRARTGDRTLDRRAFTRDARGKPELPGVPVSFSIAHAHGRALIALGDRGVRLGVDLEAMRVVHMSPERGQRLLQAGRSIVATAAAPPPQEPDRIRASEDGAVPRTFAPAAPISGRGIAYGDHPPLPACGERVGVRGGCLLRSEFPPLTLTLSPSQVQGDGERESKCDSPAVSGGAAFDVGATADLLRSWVRLEALGKALGCGVGHVLTVAGVLARRSTRPPLRPSQPTSELSPMRSADAIAADDAPQDALALLAQGLLVHDLRVSDGGDGTAWFAALAGPADILGGAPPVVRSLPASVAALQALAGGGGAAQVGGEASTP